jgi:glycosyltransferase involved in cell wall biosynthesis
MPTEHRPLIALVSNTAWSLYRFRLGLARALRAAGYDVLLIAPSDAYSTMLIKEGFAFEVLNMRPHRGGLFSELRVFLELHKIYRQYKPALIFHYTIKPNIYGSLVSRWLGIPCVAVVTGLGKFLSVRSTWRQWFMDRLYHLGCYCSSQVWFLNQEDEAVFISKGLLTKEKSRILPSEGVDTSAFTPESAPIEPPLRFLFAGRLLREKGIELFVEAARIMTLKYPNLEYQVLGFIDPENPDSVTHSQVKKWVEEGAITYLGTSDDVSEYLAAASCVVLPTYYHEGIPRVLLEAAATARPSIASNHVGCRDVIEDGKEGFLCQPRSVAHLVEAMERFVHLPLAERKIMAGRGREKVVRLYDEKIVVKKYLNAIHEFGIIAVKADHAQSENFNVQKI